MEEDKPNNPQAFPCDSRESRTFSGMTLRDYFAAKFMQGMTARAGNPYLQADYQNRAENAYKMADAMLKERRK